MTEEPSTGDRRVPADPLPVEVELDGSWSPGFLIEWARWDDRGWMGYCRWSTGPGAQYLRWVPASRTRPRNG